MNVSGNENNQNENNQNENNQNENNQNENLKKKRGGSQKRSWVWKWFVSNETGSLCQVEVVDGEICGKHYHNGNSTGVLIDHLVNKHHLTKEMSKQDYVVRNK